MTFAHNMIDHLCRKSYLIYKKLGEIIGFASFQDTMSINKNSIIFLYINNKQL